MFGGGVTPLKNFTDCLGQNCGTECPGFACPGKTIGFNSTDPNLMACDQCLGENCCDSWTTISTDFNDQNCSGDPNCMILADLQACELDINSAACQADMDAKKGVQCEQGICGDGMGMDHLCGAPICNSGIIIPGGGACSACLGTNCCTEFLTSTCEQNPSPDTCTTWLMDFNSCGTDPTCGGDTDAAAAFQCQNDTCATECGGGAGGGGG